MITALLVGGLVLGGPVAQAASSLFDVFVTNDAAHPVPVRDQNVDANGNLKTHEQGIANVNITNGTLSVRSAGIPYQVSGTANLGSGSDGGQNFPIPAGKLLVVQTASAMVLLPPGQTAAATLEILPASGSFTSAQPVPIPLTDQGTNVGGDEIFSGTQPLTAYAPSNPTGINISVGRSGTAGPAVAQLAISGYLIDEPN
jgi:hypothetical protein